PPRRRAPPSEHRRLRVPRAHRGFVCGCGDPRGRHRGRGKRLPHRRARLRARPRRPARRGLSPPLEISGGASRGTGSGITTRIERDVLPTRYASPTLVARGGMGEVYRATDSTLSRVVAIKMLAERHARDAEVRARFTREALAAARLSGEPYVIT